jgi:hypothetical protein
MNRLLLLALALTACSDPARPGNSAPCGANPSPNQDFCQTYVAEDSMPGSPLTISLRIQDTTITGNGRYASEAGTTGAIAISGLLRQPYLDLALSYHDGSVLHYSGRFAPDDRITGALFDTAGHSTPLSFVAQ